MRTAIDVNGLDSLGVLINISGRRALNKEALVLVAHSCGMTGVDTALQQINESFCCVKATVTGSRGTYSGLGDAVPADVVTQKKNTILRMAESRAICRALKLYIGTDRAFDRVPPRAEDLNSSPPARCHVCSCEISGEENRASLLIAGISACGPHAVQWATAAVVTAEEAAALSLFLVELGYVGARREELARRCILKWGKRLDQMESEQRSAVLAQLRDAAAAAK